MKRGHEKCLKCLNCRRVFILDYRNRHHQRYCGRPECRKASRKASQKRWLSKPENQFYFRGPAHVKRAQQWRKDHPERKHKKTSADLKSQQTDKQTVIAEQRSCNASCASPPLQDVFVEKNPLIVGLIAQLTGHTLQDDIATTARKLIDQGRNILGLVGPIHNNLNLDYDRKTSDSTGAVASHSAQL